MAKEPVKSIGELNGMNAIAFKVTIWGAPILVTILLTLFTAIGVPWIRYITTQVSEVPHKVDDADYEASQSAQTEELRDYSDKNRDKVAEQIETVRVETNRKLDNMDDKLDYLIMENGNTRQN